MFKVPKGYITNAEFAHTDELFRMACQLAGIAPSKRQASKYRAGLGKAYAMRAAATVRLQEKFAGLVAS